MEETINSNKTYELSDYKFPSTNLLIDHTADNKGVSQEEIERKIRIISDILSEWKIKSSDIKAVVGPTVTTYKVNPRLRNIRPLNRDIAFSLNTIAVRFVMMSDSVGIEVPNDHRSIVSLKSLLETTAFRESKAALPIAIGCDTEGQPKIIDLAEAPHILMAGATKQGKTESINSIVTSLLYAKHPSELKFVFIDPKRVEFSAYAGLLKHYLAVLPCKDKPEENDNTVVKTAEDANRILRSLCIEMEQRYELFVKASVWNIKAYNEKYSNRKLESDEGHHYLPYIVIAIDEYSDLTLSFRDMSEKARARDITCSIIKLAQKGRAVGLHIVMTTQRPSIEVITGVIKCNFPTRIAFRVSTEVDSKTILDFAGAEKLIGQGDMIFNCGAEMVRVQGAYVERKEIDAVIEAIASQAGDAQSYNHPYYLPDPSDKSEDAGPSSLRFNELDDYFEEAARMVIASQKGSTSYLQRKLGIGYARAGRVMDQLESAGIVGQQEGSKPRKVLIENLDKLESLFSGKG